MKQLKRYIAPCSLIFFVCVSYFNTLQYSFVSDDIAGIIDAIPKKTWGGVLWSLRWTDVIHFSLYQVFGLQPWPYRLVNICCHGVSVVLVYWIVRMLVSRKESARADRIAFVAASLFAVHPIIIESVTWISGGVYAQYGMLFLLSFLFYVLYSHQVSEVKRRTYLFLSYGVYTFSLFFSEKAAVLFLMFFVYEWCFGNIKKQWKILMPYFIVSSIFILFYMTQLGGRITSVSQSGGSGGQKFYNPCIQIPVAFSSYLSLIFWPKNLSFYFSEPIMTPFTYALRLMVFLGYVCGVIWSALKNKKICFWLVWIIIPLLPTLTPFRIAWLVAERYAYLSVIGVFVLIAYWFDWVINLNKRVLPPIFPVTCPRSAGATRWFSTSSDHTTTYPCFFMAFRSRMRKLRLCNGVPNGCHPTSHTHLFSKVVFIFITCIFLALICRTVVRNRDWQNQDTLWTATAKTSPLIPYTWNNMGDVYSRHGEYQKAAESFQRAIRLNPTYADAYHNLAETYLAMAETGDAILMYEKALTYNPSLWQSHVSLAGIYVMKKDYKKAWEEIEKARRIQPTNQVILQNKKIIEQMQPSY